MHLAESFEETELLRSGSGPLVQLLQSLEAWDPTAVPRGIQPLDYLRWLATARPGDKLPDLVVLPLRPGRIEPRVRKRRPKEFPLLKQPRAQLRKALLEKAVTL